MATISVKSAATPGKKKEVPLGQVAMPGSLSVPIPGPGGAYIPLTGPRSSQVPGSAAMTVPVPGAGPAFIPLSHPIAGSAVAGGGATNAVADSLGHVAGALTRQRAVRRARRTGVHPTGLEPLG